MSACEEFIQRCGLTTESQQLLESQSHAVQMDVISSFHPREGTRNPDALFCSFVRSRKSRLSEPTQHTPTMFHDFNADIPAQDEVAHEDILHFVKRYGLDESTADTILAMSPAGQYDVLTNFNPLDHTRDVNKLFLSFCRSRISTHQVSNTKGLPLASMQAHHIDFFNTNNLDDTSQTALLALPAELQAEILVNFRPRETTRDNNSLFVAFVKSRTQSRYPHLVSALVQTLTNCSPQRNQRPTRRQREISPIGAPYLMDTQMPPAYGNYAALNQPVLVALTPQQFAMAWNLNEDSVNMLLEMPPAVLADVMQNFQPRDPSRDPNNVFFSFAKSRMQHHGISMPIAAPHVAPTKINHTNIVGHAMSYGMDYTYGRREFIRRYGLSGEAISLLDELSGPLQQKVMVDFAPKENTRDANKLFMSYIRSRITSTLVSLFQLSSESLELFNSLDEMVQADVVKNFAPKAETRDMDRLFQHFVRSRASGGGVQKGTKRNLDMLNCDDVASFSQRHDLTEENIDLLRSMSEDKQVEVMQKFNPRDPSRDCNGVFHKFAVMTMNQ